MSVLGAVAAAHLSGSQYIAGASRVIAIIWVGSNIFWLTGHGVWRYAVLELFALIYFYLRWSSQDAQHRQFHFLLMCSYLVTTAFYAYELAVNAFLPDAFGMTPWWFQLFSNVLFECELLFIIGYALLFRRARANRKQYYSDVEGWFAKAGAAKRGVSDFIRQGFWQKKKP